MSTLTETLSRRSLIGGGLALAALLAGCVSQADYDALKPQNDVKPELMSAHGYGEADPIAPNETAQGRAQNRRVEITLANGSAG